MGGVGGAQRPVMRVNEPRKMGFVEQPQPTRLLYFFSISYVITNGTENLSDFTSVFEPNITLQ